MLVLQSDLAQANGLTFSPDGQSLLAATGDRVQVWPRWLDTPPRKVANVQSSLERYAFTPDAKKVYLYLSGNSRVRVLTLSTGKTTKSAIPEGGPSYFYTDTEGGFVLSSYGRGSFARFDLDPEEASGFSQTWLVERRSCVGKSKKSVAVGSHYLFGGVSVAATFVSLEYRFNGSGEPYEGLVVRSAEDGTILFKKTLKSGEISSILECGLKLSIHPSCRYFAIPYQTNVRFWPLVKSVKLPDELENVDAKLARPKGKVALKPDCNGLAFHPSGTVLATVGNDGMVKLYDTTTWQVTRTFAWGIGPTRAVCFTPDGTRAAVIGTGRPGAGKRPKEGGKVVVWDVDL